MKKLNKKFNVKKVGLESYNIYYSCGSICKSYCDEGIATQYVSFKSVQVDYV